MNNARKVSTDALETLGTIIDTTQKRDAIHLAVDPVTAGERLRPSDRITVRNGIAWADDENPLGIVDPFLSAPVKPGQVFWFVMMPRMVTSLRHVWAHPAFADEVSIASPPQANEKAESEAWLRNFIDRSECPDYEVVMTGIFNEGNMNDDGDGYPYGVRNEGDYLLVLGSDAHGDIPSEFWDHVEKVTGRKVPSDMRPDHFSCSC